MGDMRDLFKAMQDDSKIRRSNNAEHSMRLLMESGLEFKVLSANGPHVRIRDIDFWASTGLFMSRDGKRRGRGILKLLKALRRTKEND